MKKSLLLAVASLAVISCSKRPMDTVDPIIEGQEPGAVRFSTSGIATVESKVTSNADGSKFDAGDIIGIYAVLDGKKLADADAFPTAPLTAYKNKKYKAGTPEAATPLKAPFTPNAAAETIYYLPGGQAYNYYAYYPTAEAAATGVVPTMNANTYIMQTSGSDPADAKAFTKQDDMSTRSLKGYPGPMMYAYYNTADKATKADGSENTDPVNLQFKYANAKLSLEIHVDKTIGSADNIDAVQLYAATGLYGNFKFDLKNASATNQATSPVMSSLASMQLNGDPDEDGTYSAYFFESIKNTTDPDVDTIANVTGFLIPTTGITDAVIRITTKDNDGHATGEAFLAELDRSSLSEATNYLEAIAAGKEYKFILKLSKKGVLFTGQIVDWVPAATDTPEIPVF